MTDETINNNTKAISAQKGSKFKSALTAITSKFKNLKPTNSKLNFKVIGITFGVIVVAFVIYYLKGFVIAALVNGKPVTRFSVVQELERRNGSQVLEGIINQAMLEQEAKKRNITITQSEVNDDIKKIEDNLKTQNTTLEAALTQQGLTRPIFEKLIRTNKLLEKMVADRISVTDEEITKYIADNKDSMPKDTDEVTLKEQVKSFLQQQKVSTESQKFFAELRAKANIKYWVRY